MALFIDNVTGFDTLDKDDLTTLNSSLSSALRRGTLRDWVFTVQ